MPANENFRKRIAILTCWLIVLGWAGAYSLTTYLRTPDIDNFRHFAEHSMKYESKTSYIFSPLLLMFFGVCVGVARGLGGFDASRWKAEPIDAKGAIGVSLYVLACALAVALTCHRASVAAGLN